MACTSKVNRQDYSKSAQEMFHFDDIVGESPTFSEAIKIAKRISMINFNVLLNGESGTGKELFAQAIHGRSRPNGPFVAVNCASIPHNLIESELFGYEGGAFTGAERGGRIGKIEAANNGTLFLDEIGDMPLEIQPALLRVIEDKKVFRLSSSRYIPVNFRLIAATNKDLWQMVQEKTFREDLYYRLSTFRVKIPSLKERGSDEIILLARYLVEKASRQLSCLPPKIHPEVYEVLTEYSWPGNVRQLENTMTYAVFMSQNGLIKKEDLPLDLRENYSLPEKEFRKSNINTEIQNPSIESENFLSLREIEEKAIKKVMLYTENDKNKVAEILGLSKSTLYRKLKEYGI